MFIFIFLRISNTDFILNLEAEPKNVGGTDVEQDELKTA